MALVVGVNHFFRRVASPEDVTEALQPVIGRHVDIVGELWSLGWGHRRESDAQSLGALLLPSPHRLWLGNTLMRQRG